MVNLGDPPKPGKRDQWSQMASRAKVSYYIATLYAASWDPRLSLEERIGQLAAGYVGTLATGAQIGLTGSAKHRY